MPALVDVDVDECDMTLTGRTMLSIEGEPRNAVSTEKFDIGRQPGDCDFADIRCLVPRMRGGTAIESSKVNRKLALASRTVNLIHEVLTFAKLLDRMASQCNATPSRQDSLYP